MTESMKQRPAVVDGAVFVGIIQVSDTVKVRSFYEDILGLNVVAETPFALVFEAGGTTLRVTPVPNFSASAASVASWRVPDIEAAVQTLTDRGVRFHGGEDKDELGIWSDPSEAGKVAWFDDPDGNTLSLSWETPRATAGAMRGRLR